MDVGAAACEKVAEGAAEPGAMCGRGPAIAPAPDAPREAEPMPAPDAEAAAAAEAAAEWTPPELLLLELDWMELLSEEAPAAAPPAAAMAGAEEAAPGANMPLPGPSCGRGPNDCRWGNEATGCAATDAEADAPEAALGGNAAELQTFAAAILALDAIEGGFAFAAAVAAGRKPGAGATRDADAPPATTPAPAAEIGIREGPWKPAIPLAPAAAAVPEATTPELHPLPDAGAVTMAIRDALPVPVPVVAAVLAKSAANGCPGAGAEATVAAGSCKGCCAGANGGGGNNAAAAPADVTLGAAL